MKKWGILLLLLIFAWALIFGQERPRKIRENDVEVVLNPLRPLHTNGQPSEFVLEEELKIDLGSADLAEAGLAEPGMMDVDSDGNIYVTTQRSNTNFIFKLDQSGKYITSFARKGQGPGEIQFPTFAIFNPNEELLVIDQRRRRLLIFDNAGNLITEKPVESGSVFVFPLSKNRYLLPFYEYDPTAEYTQIFLFICSSNLEKLKELDRTRSMNTARAKRVEGVSPGSILSVTPQNIFRGNTERGYDIWVYDHDGRLTRKIRKEYKPVEIDESFKEEIIRRFERDPEIIRKLHFPAAYPPFQFGFADERGFLFVMTYEKGKRPREYVYDVFDPEGIFIARTSLPNYGHFGIIEARLFAMAKKGRVYCFREQESGFKEIVVYKMPW
jgi:hypothetical protein